MNVNLCSWISLFFCLILGGQCPAQTVKLAFHKMANVSALGPLLLMPTDEKIRYIQAQKIEVIKISPESHPPSSSPATDEAVRSFSAKNLDARFLLIAESGDLKPVLLLSTRADDWKVTREMMRSLLTRGPKMAKENIQPDFAVLLRKNLQDHEKSNLVTSFVRYANNYLENLLEGELENMVIENHLRGIYIKERPLGFDEASFDKSMSYISRTGAAVISDLKRLTAQCTMLDKALSDEDKDLKNEIQNLSVQIQQMRKDLKEFSNQSRIYMPE